MKVSTLLALALSTGVVGLVWSTRRRSETSPGREPTQSFTVRPGDFMWVSTRSLPQINRSALGDRVRIRVTTTTGANVSGAIEPMPPPLPGAMSSLTVPYEDILAVA